MKLSSNDPHSPHEELVSVVYHQQELSLIVENRYLTKFTEHQEPEALEISCRMIFFVKESSKNLYHVFLFRVFETSTAKILVVELFSNNALCIYELRLLLLSGSWFVLIRLWWIVVFLVCVRTATCTCTSVSFSDL